MPKFTKQQLLDISEKYQGYINSQKIDLVEKFKDNHTAFISSHYDGDTATFNDGFALLMAAYSKNGFNQKEIQQYSIQVDMLPEQFYSIYDNINEVENIKSIDENGKVEDDIEYMNQQFYSRHMDNVDPSERIKAQKEIDQILNYKYDSSDGDNYTIVNLANEEHKKKVDKYIKGFGKRFAENPYNNVLFDKKFLEQLINTDGKLFNKNPQNNVENEPLYKTVKNNLNYLNTIERTTDKDIQRKLAIDRINSFVSLKNSFDRKTIGDFFKHPVDFIKEWWTLKNAKSELQEKYGFSDTGIENITNITNQRVIPDKFAVLDKKGEIVTTDATEKEIEEMGQKLHVSSSKKSAKDKLNKIQLEFDNENINSGTKKSKGSKIQFEPTVDDLSRK